MTPRAQLIAAGSLALAAALFLGGFGAGSCRNRQVVTQQVRQADAQHAEGETHAAKADVRDQQAAVAHQASQAANAEAKRLRAEVARLTAERDAAKTPPTPLEEGQGQLIQAQDVELDAKGAEIQALTSARDERAEAEKSFRAEADSLRAALAHVPPEQTHSIIAAYNPMTHDAATGYTQQVFRVGRLSVEAGALAIWQDRKLSTQLLLIGRW